MKQLTDMSKFYTMTPMRYYDCDDNYFCAKAQAMIQNTGGNCIATHKSDGEWCRTIIDLDGRVTLQSRNISKVTGQYGDKTELVPHIVDVLKCTVPRGTVLLGELCFNDIKTTSRDVGTILRCKPPKAIERQRNGHKLVFKVWDCLAAEGMDLMDEPFGTRFAAATVTVANMTLEQDSIFMCRYTDKDFEEFLTEILAAGGEGIVIHTKDYLYTPGGRPAWTTLKVKKTTGDIEVPVVDFIEPKKAYDGKDPLNWEYQIDGELVTKPYFFGWKNGVIVNHNGNLVRVTSGMTDADREWLTTDAAKEALVNGTLMAVVSGMEITEDSIRHPRLIRLRTEA